MIIVDTECHVRAHEAMPRPGCPGLGRGGGGAQIESICHVHDAALATRNLKHFQDSGIDVIDP
jgi:predicted nucleic acid-binding protein